jgi:hypothetical protein
MSESLNSMDKPPKSGPTIPGKMVLYLGAAIVAAIYFTIPNYRYFVDGLMAAIDLRDKGLAWIVHPHHPLHPLLPQLVYRMIGREASGMSELELLQIWANFAGTLACWAFVVLLRTGRMAVFTALLGLGFMAFSRAIWYFSVSPNQNTTALALQVFTLLAMVSLLQQAGERLTRGQTIGIALLTSLAILSSQINAVLLIPGAYLMLRGEGPLRCRIPGLLFYVAVTAVATIGAYLLLGVFLLGFRSPAEFLFWQHSYVYESRWWAQSFGDAIKRNILGLSNVLIASDFKDFISIGSSQSGATREALLKHLPAIGVQVVILLFLLFETVDALYQWMRGNLRLPIQTLGLAIAVPILLFSCVWTPESSNYRILYIPGWLLLLLPHLERQAETHRFNPVRAWPVLVVLLLLFTVNLTKQALPQSNPTESPYVYEITKLSGVGPGDYIIYSGTDAGRLRQIHAKYFLRCDAVLEQVFLREYRENPDEVAADLRARHQAGHILLAHEDALFSEEDREWMNRQYGAEISPGELVGVLNSLSGASTVLGMVNGKKYYLFALK